MTTLFIGISIGFAIGVIYGTFSEKRSWEAELQRISRQLTGQRLPNHPVTQDLIFRLTQGKNHD